MFVSHIIYTRTDPFGPGSLNRESYTEMLICLSLLFFILPNFNGPSISPQKLFGGSMNVIS
jgi:hypothetical protein